MPTFGRSTAAIQVLSALLVLMSGCGRDAAPTPRTDAQQQGTSNAQEHVAASAKPATIDADLKILFIGNSHTSANRLPEVVARLLQADGAGVTVHVGSCASGAFLADHAKSSRTCNAITDGAWNYVVLQAQKYSTSGRYSYPYDGAIALSKLATDSGAGVVMFPEWSRAGHPAEGARVHKLHEEIAAITGAQVAPIGLAWDRALAERPELELHDSDGNHAAPWGTYLTACTFYSVFTGRSPQGLPAAGIDIPDDTRVLLQDSAWKTVHRQE